MEAALILKLDAATPMHYGELVGSLKDARAFKKGLDGKIEVKILSDVRLDLMKT